jgi:hypothetical protein
MFRNMFPGKDYDEVTAEDFRVAARKDLLPPEDVRTWTFGECVNQSYDWYEADLTLRLKTREPTEERQERNVCRC